MRNKKKVMRRVWIWASVVLGLCVVGVGGIFFVFGDETLEVVGLGDRDSGVRGQDGLSNEDVGMDDDDVSGVASGGASGGGGGGSSSGGGDAGGVCSEWQPVQYSIGNFFEHIECLVYGVGGCDKVKAVCGSEVFNLDYEAGGNFGIRFSLFEGVEVLMGQEVSGEEIGFEIIEEGLGARERVSLMSEIVVDGEFNVGELRCVVNSESVPMKCVG